MRRTSSLSFPGFLMLGAVSCGAPTQEMTVDSSAAEEAELDALQTFTDEVLAAVNQDDVETFLSRVTDHVVLVPPDQPTVAGKEIIRSGGRETFGARTSDEEWFTDKAIVSGEWGFLRGDYAVTITPEEGDPFDRQGKQILIFKKVEDGSWKLARVIWNLIERSPQTESEWRAVRSLLEDWGLLGKRRCGA